MTLKAVREELTATELANKCNIHPANTAIEGMASAFDDASLAEPQIPERNSEMLYAKIGQLVTERDASQRHRGHGRWIDNCMIERGWRSLKYECIYPNAFETGSEARNWIGRWTAYHNEIRLHSSHGRLISAEILDHPHRHRSVPETVCFSP